MATNIGNTYIRNTYTKNIDTRNTFCTWNACIKCTFASDVYIKSINTKSTNIIEYLGIYF